MSLVFHSAVFFHFLVVITRLSNCAIMINVHPLVCVQENSTANFPWTYTLSAGEVLRRITWARLTPSAINILQLTSAGVLHVYPGTGYEGRVNTTATLTNGRADLEIRNVPPNDTETYRCTVTTTGVSGVATAELDFKVSVEPVLNRTQVNLRVVASTKTSATLEWNEPHLNGKCDEILTYHVEYRTVQSVSKMAATSWVPAGFVNGTAYRNETMTYEVTGLEGGKYNFSVTANNSIGSSERAESLEAFEIIIAAGFLAFIALYVHNVLEGQCLYSSILMTAIMVAEKYNRPEIVKHLGSIGPLLGVVLAVVVIVIGFAPPNNGHGGQTGFIPTMVISGVSGGLSLGASIAGFLHKTHIGKTLKFPVVTMPLLFSAGVMTSITGIVISALHVPPGLFGIIFGAVCIVLLLAVFAWYLYEVCTKMESNQVSQDLSAARSQHQVELEEGAPGSNGKPANPLGTPNHEVKTSDSLTKSVHGKPRMLPPLQLDPPKQKKKNKGKRKKKTTEEEKKVTEPGGKPE